MSLAGSVVQRVDSARSAVALQIRRPGETLVVLVVACGAGPAVGALPVDERRDAWEGHRLPLGLARTKLARSLEGAKIVALGERSVWLTLGDDAIAIRARPHAVELVDAPFEEGATIVDEDTARDRGRALAKQIAAAALEDLRDRAARALAKGIARVGRRVEAVKGDLARMAEADGLIAAAQWALSEAARAPRGAKELSYTDWSSGEASVKTIALDPAKSAKAQVEAMFKKARRLKQGAVFARARLEQAERALSTIESARAQIASASGVAEIEALVARAREAAPRDVKLDEAPREPGRKAAVQQKSPCYRTFRSGEAKILVGKGASQNDELTLHVARPHDLWMHAKGLAGAHVVVPLSKGRDCPPELLVDAAHLAAHFSDARGERVADIAYASRKHVRKPKGSPPGLVHVDREKVLVLRVEPARMERLLASEEI